MGIAETLEYIHNVKWQGSKPGLERTRELLAAIGNPQKSLKFVHIAGTNGKGSTAACVASILRKAGYRTGLYTSPYVLKFNERMQADGENISDEELVRLTNEIRPFADVMEDAPTEFEMITALAMNFFSYKNCAIVVLEAGMGGELDSTNIIDLPEVAVITAIGYDHVKELGPALTDIAAAKAGIIKGGDVLIYGSTPEVEAVFEKVCYERGATLHRADFERITREEFSLDCTKLSITPYGEISIPLVGSYQPKNVLTAISAIEILQRKGYKISDNDIISGLASVYWPGRFEILGLAPVFILDGAHNPQGMEVTVDSLRRHFGEKKIHFIIGVMADKDVDSMMSCIAPAAAAFFAVMPNNPRAMDTKTLGEKLSRFGAPVRAFDSIEKGVMEAVCSAGKDGIVCAAGSLYFSGDVRHAYAQCTSTLQTSIANKKHENILSVR